MKRLPITLSYKYAYLNHKAPELPRQSHDKLRAVRLIIRMGLLPTHIPATVRGPFHP